MTTPDQPREQRPILGLLLATGVSAAAGYGVLILSARSLDPATNAKFLVFWGALFGLYSVLTGLTTETTRAVFAGTRGIERGARVVPIAASVAAAVFVIAAAIGLIAGRPLFGGNWFSLVADVLLGVVLYTVHGTLTGAAAGGRRWTEYGSLIAIEATARLALCIGAVWLGQHLGGLAFSAAAASGTTLLLTLASRRLRTLWAARTDVSAREFAYNLVIACSASGVSGVLVVGYPVLVRLTSDNAAFARAAPILLAVSLSRAPLLVPLLAYQNVVVTQVISRGAKALIPVCGFLGALTAVGAALSVPLGPWALHIVAPNYNVSSAVFPALVLGAGGIAILTLTGAAALALGHHAVYLAGWVVATVVAAGILNLDADLQTRVMLSLTLGPLVGIAVHALFGLRRTTSIA